ncbi:hypothetical protein Ancab_029781 [Ancistrocladus abbreviatus]
MASTSSNSIFSNPFPPTLSSSHSSPSSFSKLTYISFLHISSRTIKFLKPISHNPQNAAGANFIITSVSKKTIKSPSAAPATSTGRDAWSENGTVVKPTILVSEKLGEAGIEVLRSLGNVDCAYDLTQEELCKKIASCEELIVRSGTKVTRQVFEAGKGKLKVVGRAGVAIDNVDLQAATEFGCLVVNAPTANTVAAAEHGIALLTAMARNIPQADASMKAGKINCPFIPRSVVFVKKNYSSNLFGPLLFKLF